MLKRKLFIWISIVVFLGVLVSLPCVTFAATTVSVLEGKITITDTNNNTSVSNGIVTVKAKGGYLSQTTNTITIANASGANAEISFNYSASNYKSFSENLASGSKSVILESGKSITMSITGKKAISSNTATLTLSNFKIVQAATSSNVTVTYDNSLGSITIDNSTVTSGSTHEIDAKAGAKMKAVANSGASFLGWMDTNTKKMVETSASYSCYPVSDMSLQAVFTSATSKAWFVTKDSMYFDNLNTACTHAAGLSDKTVVLAADGTLLAGNYTIPAGVTLLIPYDLTNTLCTTAPKTSYLTTHVNPTIYRKMIMAEGANITVTGSVSISATVNSAIYYNGAPTGPVGLLYMNSGSSITVSGNLYAWGFIAGDGEISALSGANVYEPFQFVDFRGGGMTSSMVDNDERIFPMTSYYVQNIQVPLSIYSGAEEHVFMAVNVSIVGDKSTSLQFIGTKEDTCMFRLNSGYIIKDYDEESDRLYISMHGELDISNIEFSIKLELLGSTTINSSNYVLTVPSSMSFMLKGTSKLTINQDIALLPGTQIFIDKDATVTLGQGKELYVYDLDTWSADYKHAKGSNLMDAAPYAYPDNKEGKRYKMSDSDLKDAEILINGTADLSAGSIYTTSGGANIYSTENGVIKITGKDPTVTYQMIQEEITSYSEMKNSGKLVEIPVTSAWLKNGDGSYVETANTGDGTYHYFNSAWYIPTLSVHSTADREDGMKIDAEYRLQDYLWLNAVCYLDQEFTNVDPDKITFNGLTDADVVVVTGEDSYPVLYIVKKIPSDEIADTVTFTIEYNDLISAPIIISVADCKYSQAQIDAMSDADKLNLMPDETNDLVDALITYGEAAKKYFVIGGTPESLLDMPIMTDYTIFNKTPVAPAFNTYNNVSLVTKGANVLFEERLSMIFGFQFTGTMTEDDVVQVGVLIGSVNGGELTATLENVTKAYILFGKSNDADSDNKPTLPSYDDFEVDAKETVSWDNLNASGRMTLYMDLKSEDYTSAFEFRPFVITNDGTVLYGAQYAYSLADYINNMLTMSDVDLKKVIDPKDVTAFRNLLAATWDYALKAEARFGQE